MAPRIMAKPLVSFLATTYGRAVLEPELISEMVYWFLQTDYEPKELVIGNDAPDQTVIVHAPNVKVINFYERFPTWGDKLNATLEYCQGEIVLPQDDDDVPLPHRASLAVEMLEHYEYWNPHRWWCAPKGTEAKVWADGRGCGWNCSAYRREAFRGHYAKAYAEADQRAHEWASANLNTNGIHVTDDADITYVYRWGVSSQHFSGNVNLKQAYDNMRCGPAGTYNVYPKMGAIDWAKVCYAKVHSLATY